ncbi:MAG: hypothetical protein ACTHJN_03095 [Ginsengibacter sp.]
MEESLISVPKELWFVNIGEPPQRPKPGSGWVRRRNWDANKEYGFISAGQHPKYSNQLTKIQVDDVVAAYITGKGYVGIGIVSRWATPIKNYQNLRNAPYILNSLFENSDNLNSEFAIGVNWQVTKERGEACWKSKSGLFSTRLIVCSLLEQATTINFLQDCFAIKFKIFNRHYGQ